MALDPYQSCPCGSGKKIKFCCCKDITADLDNVLRALEGEQRVAGLQQVDNLLTKHGDREALLTLKATTQMQLDNWEEADDTVQRFVAKAPNNPVALAQTAMIHLSRDDVDAAVKSQQRAIEKIGDQMPMGVYESIGAVAQSLLVQGKVPAARAHLVLQAAIGGEDDPRPSTMLMRIHGAAEVPLLLKQDVMFAPCDDDASWKPEFDEAQKLSNRGAWLAASEKLATMNEQHPGQPAILKNLALLHLWLGDHEAAISHWRKYATSDTLELDEAVEAEALAQLLDPNVETEELDIVTTTFAVADAERLMEQLISERRMVKMPVDPHTMGDDDNPPPKGVFWLLDKAMPKTGKDISRDDISSVLGEIYLFGKQTDRESRLEFTADRSDDFEASKASLVESLGDLLGSETSEEVTDHISKLQATLTWNWRLPDDTPPKLRAELIEQQRGEVILNRWPEVAQVVLDGKTATEAATDSACRVPLLGAILLLEMAGSQNRWRFDFNTLREHLGLPQRELLDPSGLNVRSLSLVRLSQLDVEKVADDDLVHAYIRAGRSGAVAAVQRLAPEVVRRDSLDENVDKAEAYEFLSRFSDDPKQAIEYIGKARQVAVGRGDSPAAFLIAEMAMQLEQHNSDEFQRLLNEVRNRHINEPGVGQMLMETLSRYGLIDPQGRPVAPPEAMAQESAEADSKLWTPDGGPAESGGEEKSKLWVPGMD